MKKRERKKGPLTLENCKSTCRHYIHVVKDNETPEFEIKRLTFFFFQNNSGGRRDEDGQENGQNDERDSGDQGNAEKSD